MAHNEFLQRVALEALECGENTVAQLRDDLDIAIERYQQQRAERDTIGYDTWEDFADLLAARGRVNVDRVPNEWRERIVASYPHGAFANDGSHDLLWQITGGPWFDTLERQLIAGGYGHPHTADGRALYMVLADGETYTPLEGCRIVAAPRDIDDDDLDDAIKHHDPRLGAVISFGPDSVETNTVIDCLRAPRRAGGALERDGR